MSVENVRPFLRNSQHVRYEEREDGIYELTEYDVINVFTGTYEQPITVERALTRRTLWSRLRALVRRKSTNHRSHR